ncbi:MAG TPA: (2Fe-2S) ferredoxin domain-containing protein [Thermomicrobiales bacterium]|nr:(2Fe-2S) ferredoxin domain-containing protein [Thermomicrobiales bacterium]
MYWTRKHVMVCTASHCNQKGAMDVVGRLRLEVIRKGLDAEILVNNCGTIDLCDCGPNMVVYPDNVIYNGVTVKDIPEIMEHLKGGPVVERLVLAADSEAELQRRGFYAEAVAFEGGQDPEATKALASSHALADTWVDEQLRRGFMARKPDAVTGEDRILVTKKARVRYTL